MMQGPLFTSRRAAQALGRRGYATRPLPRPKDPLQTSKTAVVSEIAPGLTFFHRPPPSAPVPHSLTTAPSSPLLRPASLSSFSTSSDSASASASTNLPPVLGSGPPEKKYHLTDAQISEMRSLRASDPEANTVGVLAKRFECSESFVKITAPASKARREAVEREIEEEKATWGHRKRLQREIRQKRRSLW